MSIYCILGGGGSFGIQTALFLLEHTPLCSVVGMGRSPLRMGAFSLGVEAHPRFEYRQCHIVHEHDLLMAYLDALQPDTIINFAAQGEGAVSWQHSWRFFDTNATALVRLYEALSRRTWFNPRGRFIHISTSELYGSVTAPAREDAPIVPSSPYAASKAAFDLHLLAMHRAGLGAPMVILRPSNCYCPGQLLHRVVPRAVVAGLTGQRIPLHGGGRARKSYLHARDLARAIYLVASHDGVLEPVYNVGPPEPISIRDLVGSCAEALGIRDEDLFEVADERVGQDAQYWLDSSAIARDLGWWQEIGLGEGLAEVRDWAAANLDELRSAPTDYRLRA